MNLEELKSKKRQLGLTTAQVSVLSGVPEATLAKIFAGITKNPRSDTLLAIENILCTTKEGSGYCLRDSVSEASAQKRAPGSYTMDDIQALPEGTYTELIDGFLYDFAAPSVFHQLLLEDFRDQVRSFIRTNGGSCVPLLCPVGVFLGEDASDYLIPDFTVTCDRSRIFEDGIHGAPDFVLEVLSPATESKDRYVKFTKYCTAGVREYWIIDPKKQIVTINYFTGKAVTKIHPLTGTLPIGIFEQPCLVDLDRLKKAMDSLYSI